MNVTNGPSPKEVFANVRAAYRLLHDYQRMVLDAVRYIESQFSFDGVNVYQRFSGHFSDGADKIDQSAWDWLPMVLCEVRFWKQLQNDYLSLSLYVISDTGYVASSDKEKLSAFAASEESSTMFALIMTTDWRNELPQFMEDHSQMSDFISKRGSIPDSLIGGGAVGKSYDISCLMSEAEANKIVADILELARSKSWPLALSKGTLDQSERRAPTASQAAPVQP